MRILYYVGEEFSSRRTRGSGSRIRHPRQTAAQRGSAHFVGSMCAYPHGNSSSHLPDATMRWPRPETRDLRPACSPKVVHARRQYHGFTGPRDMTCGVCRFGNVAVCHSGCSVEGGGVRLAGRLVGTADQASEARLGHIYRSSGRMHLAADTLYSSSATSSPKNRVTRRRQRSRPGRTSKALIRSVTIRLQLRRSKMLGGSTHVPAGPSPPP
jgi:hypothetical protein